MSILLPVFLSGMLTWYEDPPIPVQPDLNTQLIRATVKIEHPASTATGFILADKGDDSWILVTAAHVLNQTPGNTTTVILRQQVEEGVYKKILLTLPIRKDDKSLWTKHPTEDVAVLRIKPPREADLPRIPVDWLATDKALTKSRVHPGEDVLLVGYPHRIEANPAGFPIVRKGPIASYPLLPSLKNKTFLMSTNCFEGDSGGMVYLGRPENADESKPRTALILGLISGQHFLDEEMKMVYGLTRTRHRLGIAIVVQASLIRETIEKLP